MPAYQGKYASDIRVITPTLAALGWVVYIGYGNNIFQLTPLRTEAEQMLDPFKFTEWFEQPSTAKIRKASAAEAYALWRQVPSF